jgi:hypothetical protein
LAVAVLFADRVLQALPLGLAGQGQPEGADDRVLRIGEDDIELVAQ